MTKRTILPAGLSILMCLPNTLPAQNQPTTTPIKHVVVIFQENVSFDHYFATYPTALNTTPGEPVFTPATGTPSVNGLNGPLLTANPNAAAPFRLSRAQAVTCDQGHAYGPEQKAANAGLMNLFVESVGVGNPTCDIAGFGKKIVMGYYDGNTVTAFWNYAQNFSMSDNSFNTQFGPSTPGALNLISGQTNGATLTSGNAAGSLAAGTSTVIGDPRPSLALDDCTIKTAAQITMSGTHVGDLMNAAKVTWGWFQGGFKPSTVNSDGTAVCATTHNNISGASAGTDYIPHHEPFQYFAQSANPHHLPPTSVQKIGQSDQANHQYDLSDFFNALSASNLPAVSYLKAGAYQDGHAGYSDPLDEQTFLVNTINSIMQSPFWASTAIIIAYDDSDGWYDHVMGPIVHQSSTSDDALNGAGSCGNGANEPSQGRCGYGPRLPLMVISPFAKVNYVDHTTTDQVSILRFIEDNWSLGRIGNNSNDAIAGSLLGMFNFANGTGTAQAVFLDPSTGKVSGAPTTTAPTVTKAVAGPKNIATTLFQIQLDGTASTSFDGKPLTYQWSVPSGSQFATVTGDTTATPTVTLLSTGPYTFQLTVTDSAGNTSTDTATINSFR